MDIIEGLLTHQVLFVEQALKRDLPEILAAPPGGPTDEWGHSNYRHPAYALCYLYQCRHPANPLRGQEWLRETAVQLIDTYVDARAAERATHARFDETEWPPYVLCYAVQVFGDSLGIERLTRWADYIHDYARHKMVEPAFFTSPNHELWRFLTLYTAGQTFSMSAWCETAMAMLHQLLHWQTAEGFWEEGVHHGPSMKYNHLALHPLAWLYTLTDDQAAGEAAQRLARFMVTYTFPDGSTVGCFDGRQSMSPGYFAPACPGLELAPGGLTLTQRMIDQRRRLGMLDQVRALGSSIWYGYFDFLFVSDACRYYEGLPTAEDAPLPIDADGAVLENHTTTFDGVLARKGPWVVALSGQESDIPKIGAWVYRLERQSRIDLWHERAGVVLGGGHNLTKQAVPLANVVVVTGFGGTVEQGEVKGEDDGRRRSTYICRAAETEWAGASGRLTVHFLHGEVTFDVEPLDGRTAAVRFTWTLRGVQRLAVQVPIVVWRGGRLTVGGRDVAGVADASAAVRVEHPRLGYAFEVSPPRVGVPYVRYPMEPVRTYGQLFAEERFDSPYTIGLLGTQIDDPEPTGSGAFVVRF